MKREKSRPRAPRLDPPDQPWASGRWAWVAAFVVLLVMLTFAVWQGRRADLEVAPDGVDGPAVMSSEAAASFPRPTEDPAAELAIVETDPNSTSMTIVTPRLSEMQRREVGRLDPRQDGWRSEVLAESASNQLQRILDTGHTLPDSTLAQMLSRDFACAPLRPNRLERIYRDDTLLVQRSTKAALQAAPPIRGARGLIQSLRHIQAVLGNDPALESTVKLYQMQVRETALAARARIEINAQSSRTRGQIRAEWDCLWSVDGAELRLSAIRVANYEEVLARYPEHDWFVDATTDVLRDTPAWTDQLSIGLDDWLQHIERAHSMHVFMASGVATGDANGDGLDDLYVCQPGGLPNRLFVQNLDGSAHDVSQRARVDWLDSTSSALFADLDNDGDQDLVLATLIGLVILENDGAARFRLAGTLPTGGADPQSLSAVDYDNDSDLDLFVCLNFPKVSGDARDEANAFVYHDANDGARNHLFQSRWFQDGQWRFSDVTESSGLGRDNTRHSLAAAWEDFDNDGDQDLYIANDYGQNCLYRNDGGQFRNVASDSNVVDSGSGMSVSWSDYDRDGWMDLYVGNMFSSAGGRITAQPQFRPGIDDETRTTLRRFAKGNSLFRNSELGRFEEVGAAAQVEIGRWAWSSIFVDLNNSGWDDILVANGYITTDDTGDL